MFSVVCYDLLIPLYDQHHSSQLIVGAIVSTLSLFSLQDLSFRFLPFICLNVGLIAFSFKNAQRSSLSTLKHTKFVLKKCHSVSPTKLCSFHYNNLDPIFQPFLVKENCSFISDLNRMIKKSRIDAKVQRENLFWVKKFDDKGEKRFSFFGMSSQVLIRFDTLLPLPGK